jgi:hypothetical protein
MTTIKNKNRFPNVDWLPVSEYEVIGQKGSCPLLLIGRIQVSGEPIVATQRTDDIETAELGASVLDELITHAGQDIVITNDPTPARLNALESEYKDY